MDFPDTPQEIMLAGSRFCALLIVRSVTLALVFLRFALPVAHRTVL
jgi:hypothetical protein